MTRQINLTNGQHAIVDDEDYAHLLAYHWCLDNTGYAVAKDRDGRKVLMHRVIVQPLPGFQIDHINGDKLDNRRSNLRVCTHQQNSINQGKRPGTTSKYKGVTQLGRRWRAQIWHNGKRHHLGCYATEADAAREYDEAAIRLFGSFANLNFK